MLNIQLMILSASSTDEVMSSSGIEQDDHRIAI
jgi:hypothetical protein